MESKHEMYTSGDPHIYIVATCATELAIVSQYQSNHSFIFQFTLCCHGFPIHTGNCDLAAHAIKDMSTNWFPMNVYS